MLSDILVFIPLDRVDRASRYHGPNWGHNRLVFYMAMRGGFR